MPSFKITYRSKGDSFDRAETITTDSWASVGGHIAHLADNCDSILVYRDNTLVLRYDNDGVD
jgi:hypothetical protein